MTARPRAQPYVVKEGSMPERDTSVAAALDRVSRAVWTAAFAVERNRLAREAAAAEAAAQAARQQPAEKGATAP